MEAPVLASSATITIENLRVPVSFKKKLEKNAHYICILSHSDVVLATEVLRADKGKKLVHFGKKFTFQNMRDDFVIDVEIYRMHFGKEWERNVSGRDCSNLLGVACGAQESVMVITGICNYICKNLYR